MSLHSMTAFARETTSEPQGIVVELRSVNHRYLDCHFKLPDSIRALEPKFREAIGKRVSRGKIDIQIRVLDAEGSNTLRLDEDRLQAVQDLLSVVRARNPELPAPDQLALLQFPGVCVGGEAGEDELQAATLALFETALGTLSESRAREGAQLAEFLRRRLDAINTEVASVRDELPALRERQEERLRKRLAEIDQPVDEGRIEQELVILLQKADVDEELDRLGAHVEEVERILAKGGPCGRRLDFLMQELNREANTLSSKAVAASTTQSAVELKVLIEQMREQVQNIE